MNDGYDSSVSLDVSPGPSIGADDDTVFILIRCWILSLLTSSISRKILFRRDWMLSSSSSFCISLNDLTLSLLSMMQKFSGRALKSSSSSFPAACILVSDLRACCVDAFRLSGSKLSVWARALGMGAEVFGTAGSRWPAHVQPI